MLVEDGVWIIKGLSREDPLRIRTWKELVSWVNEVGFLPLFSNEVEGFSAEEHVAADAWWTGDREEDPWEWREIIAAGREVVYGKFFGQKAGFISLAYLPYFANFRRIGYDFDARWEDGLASRREKKIMDLLTQRDEDGEMIFSDEQILSTELKKKAGFGKGGEKNFPGTITALQMQTYLVITAFQKRVNKRGEEYGMPVSILQPPEAVWGYGAVTAAYSEDPVLSWQRIIDRIRQQFPKAKESDIVKLIGKKPG